MKKIIGFLVLLIIVAGYFSYDRVSRKRADYLLSATKSFTELREEITKFHEKSNQSVYFHIERMSGESKENQIALFIALQGYCDALEMKLNEIWTKADPDVGNYFLAKKRVSQISEVFNELDEKRLHKKISMTFSVDDDDVSFERLKDMISFFQKCQNLVSDVAINALIGERTKVVGLKG